MIEDSTEGSMSVASVPPAKARLDRARTMHKLILITGCLACAASAAMAADYEAGKKKVEEVCQACHGADGNTAITPETPRLAGQYTDYLEHSLKAYRSGQRENPLMSPMAKPLTDAEIKNLALYFSRQKGLVHKY
jgi:cytochrome c553